MRAEINDQGANIEKEQGVGSNPMLGSIFRPADSDRRGDCFQLWEMWSSGS
jgi:hypothetical protein